jgi:hypothetical protein
VLEAGKVSLEVAQAVEVRVTPLIEAVAESCAGMEGDTEGEKDIAVAVGMPSTEEAAEEVGEA